jgi:putative transposase
MGYIKGKSAIHIARVYAGRRRSFVSQRFWARGYGVSTVERDEVAVRRYIQEREKENQRVDQLTLMRFERLTETTNRFEWFMLPQASGFA